MKIITKFIYAGGVAVVILAIVHREPVRVVRAVNDRYYRFEEGRSRGRIGASGAGSIVDSYFGSPDGTPERLSGLQQTTCHLAVIPLTGQAEYVCHWRSVVHNQFSLRFIFFLLHRTFGDATLEYFIKVADQPRHSIFWTRPTTDPDEKPLSTFTLIRGGALQGRLS